MYIYIYIYIYIIHTTFAVAAISGHYQQVVSECKYETNSIIEKPSLYASYIVCSVPEADSRQFLDAFRVFVGGQNRS